MRDRQVQRLALGGVLAGLILMLTYLIKVPVPGAFGYVHLGDGAIFLSALMLGPFAALVGGIGSALADLLGGYFVYIAPTFVIKAAMGLLAGALCRRGAHLRNALAFIAAEVLMVSGYFLFDGMCYGWPTAIAGFGANALQAVAGVVMGIVLSALPIWERR